MIIRSKYAKVLAHFAAPNDGASLKQHDVIPIDLGSNPPPIYDKMNEILETKNTPKPKAKLKKSASLHNLAMPLLSSCADDASDAALNALYGQISNEEIVAHRKKRTYSI